MPSYRDTVVANGVDALWRHDELSGSVMPDASGNGNHGTYFPQVQFGLASPIETDPASFAVKGKTGKIIVAPASTLDRRDNFAWQAWGFNTDTGSPKTLICRNGHWSLNGSNILGFGGSGGVNANLRIGATDYSLIWPHSNVPFGFWYYVVLVRVDTVARLYVNGLLRDERTDLASGDINIGGSTDGYYIGLMQSDQGVWFNTGQDESAIGPATGIDAAAVLENYESALLTKTTSATINVRVIVELDTDQVVPTDFPFVHNWADALSGQEKPIIERISYQTNVNQSEPDYQQRINARPHHPKRQIEYAVTVSDGPARARLHRMLWEPGQTYKLPIWTDWTTLTAPSPTTDTTLDCDTLLREFEQNSYAVAFNDVRDSSTGQFFQLSNVAASQLTVSPAVVTALAIGNPITPARLAILTESALTADSHTADRETWLLRFEVLATELGTRRLTTYTPASTYRSIEVFSLDKARFETVETTQYQLHGRRAGTGNLTGNDYLRAVDTASGVTVPVRVLLDGRVAKAEFLGWLDARQGKQNPIWIPTQERDLEWVARVGGSQIDVQSGYFETYNVHYGRRDIQILYVDGTIHNRRITAAADNGNGTDRLTLDAGTTVGLNVSRISFLRLCTAPDEFELVYHRNLQDFVIECSFEFQELLTTPD